MKSVLILLLGFILFWAFFLLIWKISHKDIRNVFVYGKITQNNKGISNETFIFINHYYEGGDYDGFGGIKEYKISTDSDGLYKIELDKSAYIQILDINRKVLLSEKYITKKQNEINVVFKESNNKTFLSPFDF